MTVPVLQRIGRGESSAVNECVSAYGGLIWSLALRMSPTRADAEDAVQEIFMDLWRNAGAFDADKSPERVFVTMIARRRLIDRWRSRSRRIEAEPLEDSEHALEQHTEASPATGAELSEALGAIEALDAEQREVVTLGVVQGMTHSEIARHTGRPLGTVKTQMRRGLMRIRERLGGSAAAADEVTA